MGIPRKSDIMLSMQTCTWAPTVFQGTQVVTKSAAASAPPPAETLQGLTRDLVQRYEQMGVSHLLVAQRWWGNGQDIEGSSLDCLAMTAMFLAATQKINLVTAIHPGFFHPTAIAKWGATLSQLGGGRWAINITSGWNMQEFDMYGIDPLSHDERYARAAEFITVLRGAWENSPFTHTGTFYRCKDLHLEPRPEHPLRIFQGGQSDAAINMAAEHADWMFLNGGNLQRIQTIITKVRAACRGSGRDVRFALYAAPLCREDDHTAWQEIERRLAAVDPVMLSQRKSRLREGAQGMWGDADPLSALDTNEGYSSRLIGSPETILRRITEFQKIGIDMLHLELRDALFNSKVLPVLAEL